LCRTLEIHIISIDICENVGIVLHINLILPSFLTGFVNNLIRNNHGIHIQFGKFKIISFLNVVIHQFLQAFLKRTHSLHIRIGVFSTSLLNILVVKLFTLSLLFGPRSLLLILTTFTILFGKKFLLFFGFISSTRSRRLFVIINTGKLNGFFLLLSAVFIKNLGSIQSFSKSLCLTNHIYDFLFPLSEFKSQEITNLKVKIYTVGKIIG